MITALIDAAPGALATLWSQAVDVWIAGGWAMIGIALDALVMFGIGTHVLLGLIGKNFRQVPEKVWRLWLQHPEYREGPIGELMDSAMRSGTVENAAAVFQGLRATEIAPFERDLKVMKVCVASGPLLGLFGTVTGMLVTFSALATGSGGDKTMAAIAKGISEALITTETGLVVALPGLFFQYQLGRLKERYSAFLAHLESACTQHIYRQACRGQRVA
jgi:biopolymer transport protein ExbB